MQRDAHTSLHRFQRYLQVEDHFEETKREKDEKLQSLESIMKIFEIKARNASDHVGRLEEKEGEMKQEYKRLHERYCEVNDERSSCASHIQSSSSCSSYSKLIVITWNARRFSTAPIDWINWLERAMLLGLGKCRLRVSRFESGQCERTDHSIRTNPSVCQDQMTS